MTKKKREEKAAKAPKENIEKVLIDNFVNLQRVMTNLATKFDSLSDQISKLLQIFEISAKSFSEKSPSQEDKEFLEKLNVLLDQNKVIAKGITMMEEKVREKMQQNPQMPLNQATQDNQGYQPSMQRKFPRI